MDLNRLRAFQAVYQNNNTVGAARALSVTRSAVSQSLSKLEAEIGVALFTRAARGLVPTSAGHSLFRRIDPFLSSLESEVRAIKAAGERPSGLLKLGAPVAFGRCYLPAKLASFRARYPEVEFALELGNQTRLLSLLEEGELDFTIADVFDDFNPSRLRSSLFSLETLFEERMTLLCSRDYYEQHGLADTSFESLAKSEFLTHQSQIFDLKSWFRHHFGKVPPNLDIALTVDDSHALVEAVKLSLGLAVFGSHLVEPELQRGELRAVLSGPADEINRISLVQLLDKKPSLTERAFAKHLLAG
ncbi:LysR family transcriptional regulator [Pelagibius sp. Alg239-R121]|uniref:LysR family transcriptional regulator n=1 Tax=Pelagibius sp. Alg239-R121 TaxID=2993448 RepID=UPI0024A6BFCF|nr:LysR family transcriptional regulator [Pelagibius sp. Alg239-R121]